MSDSTLPARRVRSHADLIVWQRAVELATESYVLARRLPESERYGLAPQIRRSAVSVAANIAEGYGRAHRKDYVRFLAFARGSVSEVETHLHIAAKVGVLIDQDMARAHELCAQLRRMLSRMITSLSAAT